MTKPQKMTKRSQPKQELGSQANKESRPKVGVGVIVKKDNKILAGRRKNAHGRGSWCFPGGHLEFGESWEECARREAEEETGVQIKNVRFFTATNDFFKEEQKHYITIFMVADWESGEVELREPDKSEEWEWFSWDDLPEPLFVPWQNLLKTGLDPFGD